MNWINYPISITWSVRASVSWMSRKSKYPLILSESLGVLLVLFHAGVRARVLCDYTVCVHPLPECLWVRVYHQRNNLEFNCKALFGCKSNQWLVCGVGDCVWITASVFVIFFFQSIFANCLPSLVPLFTACGFDNLIFYPCIYRVSLRSQEARVWIFILTILYNAQGNGRLYVIE